jgi:probable rRNA maturation factor
MILIESAIEKKFGRAALKKRALVEFLSRAIQSARLAGSVSVLLTGDEEIRQLNRVFRRKDKATDVLSFPAMEMNGNRKLAGDLAISVETAAREAEQRQHGLDVELKVLLLHGVLHLAGWDHERDFGEMARKEEALRKRLGLKEGLIGRAQGSGIRDQVPAARSSTTASGNGPRRGRRSIQNGKLSAAPGQKIHVPKVGRGASGSAAGKKSHRSGKR